jgi:hypothetical protein
MEKEKLTKILNVCLLSSEGETEENLKELFGEEESKAGIKLAKHFATY